MKILYPQLTDGQLKAISNLTYNGWGRLSERFLNGIEAPAPETGEAWTIIRCMWETNDNLMQVLSDKYLFAEAVERENHLEQPKDLTYKM
jgi:CRISPR-associated endonuclease Csn1